jgi:hypothetical protein
MQSIDICYTPLDIPIRPNINIPKFMSWAQSVYPQLCKADSANAESFIGEEYPWDLVWGSWNGAWQNDFDKQFPELADYCYKAFNIKRYELGGAIFLPVRKAVTGTSFWHNDVDPTGFRFYIECEHHIENPLLLRKTIVPYTELSSIVVQLNSDDDRISQEVFNCKMIDPHMAYYLNNFRAVHAPTVNVLGIRIAAFITVKKPYQEIVRRRTNDMIVASATKFKDHAILW